MAEVASGSGMKTVMVISVAAVLGAALGVGAMVALTKKGVVKLA